MYSYLVYRLNPLDDSVRARAYISSGSSGVAEVALADVLKSRRKVVSYELGNLFGYIRTPISIGATLLDICQAARLVEGRPHRRKDIPAPWSIQVLLAGTARTRGEVNSLLRAARTISDAETSPSAEASMARFAELLARAWQKVEAGLEASGNRRRFFEIEQPVNQLLLARQLRGIGIRQRELLVLLSRLDRQASDSSRVLRSRWGIRDPDERTELRKALQAEGLSSAWRTGDADSDVEDTRLDLLAGVSDLAWHIKTYRHSREDKRRLLGLGVIGNTRVRPTYNTLGTVSGRIMVSIPALQFIRKPNRGIVVPDRGRKLLYPDFAQFEPGILADDSRDARLLHDYNAGDLYAALSQHLFGDSSKRDASKVLFIAFCYGMQLASMSKLLSDLTSTSMSDASRSLEQFFGRYERLAAYRRELEEQLAQTGRVGTRLGCFRQRERGGPLTSAEKRWVVNQRVQSTAALILKRIILRVGRHAPDIDILLPMHDALLVQVPAKRVKESTDILRSIFTEEFRRECPRVNPRVTFGPFAEQDVPVSRARLVLACDMVRRGGISGSNGSS